MNLEGIVLSKISQTEKDKQYGSTYTWNLKNTIDQKKKTKYKQTHRYGEQISGWLLVGRETVGEGKGGKGLLWDYIKSSVRKFSKL